MRVTDLTVTCTSQEPGDACFANRWSWPRYCRRPIRRRPDRILGVTSRIASVWEILVVRKAEVRIDLLRRE